MQLEQMMYQPMQMQRTQERQRVYTIVDLESLSASALYGISGPLGGSRPLSGSKPLSFGSSGPLTIRDFPSLGFQLKIHEGPGGTAHITKYGTNKIISELNSYDAAMADLLADKLDIKKILKKYGLDKD